MKARRRRSDTEREASEQQGCCRPAQDGNGQGGPYLGTEESKDGCSKSRIHDGMWDVLRPDAGTLPYQVRAGSAGMTLNPRKWNCEVDLFNKLHVRIWARDG